MDLRGRVCALLGCPPLYLGEAKEGEAGGTRHCLLAADQDWLGSLLSDKEIPPNFVTHPLLADQEVATFLKDGTFPDNDWDLVELDIIPNKDDKFIAYGDSGNEDIQSISEVLQHIDKSNTFNMWQHFRPPQPNPSSEAQELDIIQYIWKVWGSDVPIITRETVSRDVPPLPATPSVEDCPHITPLLACVVTETLTLLMFRHNKFTLSNLLNFSPSLLGESHYRSRFIIFQIVTIYKELHERGIPLGHITLQDFLVEETLLVKLRFTPKPIKFNDLKKSPNLQKMSLLTQQLCIDIDSHLNGSSSKLEYESNLAKAVTLWSEGSLSNLDYLLFLNYLAGRRYGEPNNHPVVPWVVDFSSSSGGWRDLTRSKFRLTKGDQALDLTYDSGSSPGMGGPLPPPHHVTDTLSEITYFTYKSRVTDKAVLCRNVRPNWVPAEYPSSVERLMWWSPDECIPEFYTDPAIFTSEHHDLPDLELPPWAPSPQEFIAWHRQMLESSHVSQHLHVWIDLTFGYKLSGPASVRSKNVCLDLVDNHTDLRNHGVVQLFSQPHPIRERSKIDEISLFQFAEEAYVSESEESDIEDLEHVEVEPKIEKKVNFPEGFNPLSDLYALEGVESFKAKAVLESSHDKSLNLASKQISRQEFYEDFKVLGCLIIETFLPKLCLSLGINANLERRYEFVKKLLVSESKNLPSSVKLLVRPLLENPHASVDERGIPLATPMLLLNKFTSPSPFPPFFMILHSSLKAFSQVEHELHLIEMMNPAVLNEASLKSTELLVNMTAKALVPHLENISKEDCLLMVPFIKTLICNPSTAVLASWLLFDSFASNLGTENTKKEFLQPISSLYCNGSPTAKHLKLYHRSFLVVLMVRFKLEVFLQHFINCLIEAVGGYKDLEWDEVTRLLSLKPDNLDDLPPPLTTSGAVSVEEAFSEGEVFSFDGMDDLKGSKSTISDGVLETVVQHLGGGVTEIYTEREHEDDFVVCQSKYTRVCANGLAERLENGQISEVALESVEWLGQRLGPVLASRHLARNLLRMLSLCYMGQDGVSSTGKSHPDQKIRLSPGSVGGDLAAGPVLSGLISIASVYGEGVVLAQYLPFATELVTQAKKRISSVLEGGLLGCLSLLHRLLPSLSDSTLLRELPASILAHLLVPMLQVITSRRIFFSGGARPRLVLLYKLLDVVYLIGLRIGEELTRTHLTPIVMGLFSSFSKAKLSSSDSSEEPVLVQLQQVLRPDLAYVSYVAFYNMLGGGFLEANIQNIDKIKLICGEFQTSLQSPIHRPVTYAELGTNNLYPEEKTGSSSFGGSGNKIVVESGDTSDNAMISRPIRDGSRQLKGNWLAYWEHEIGRDLIDSSFNVKQIKLQSFVGHTGGVRSLAVLDNENSFLSSSKDKTVRLWSIRNTGDGDASVQTQSAYMSHKKSVFSVSYLHSRSHAASCDGTVHLWDPFVSTTLREYEAGRGAAFCAMKAGCLPPCNMLVAATTEGLIKLLDTRGAREAMDLRVGYGAAGLVRSVCIDPAGLSLSVGHSSGYISTLDLRIGKVRTGWKGHDGEVLSLVSSASGLLISSSLDQTVTAWRWEDGRQAASLRAPQEPVTCLAMHGQELVMGSAANRIAIQARLESNAPCSVTKLKSDLLKGNLTQLAVLPLNRQLLVGTDSGQIHLLC